MSEKAKSFFFENIPFLIQKHKKMIKECYKVMGSVIDADLSDDKMVNVIKSKRLSAETAEWSCKEVDRLQSELTGAENNNNEKPTTDNFSERMAR